MFVEESIHYSSITCKDSTESEDHINYLSLWLQDDKPFDIPSFEEKMYKCHEGNSEIHRPILSDLQRLLNNPPKHILIKIIRLLETMPYYDQLFYRTGEHSEFVKKFMLETKLMADQMQRVHELRQNTINRYSYGMLFVSNGKFLVVPHNRNKSYWRFVKGQPKLKMNGTFETAWETAIRETSEQLIYKKVETNGEWCPFNIDEYKNKWAHCTYLEYAFECAKIKKYSRLVGLFVIYLAEAVEFQTKLFENVQVKCKWISFEKQLNGERFYTIRPFIEYLKSNPHLLSVRHN